MSIGKRGVAAVAIGLALLATQFSPARATSLVSQNLVDLVSLSQRILVGDVVALSDGFDANGYPYTEVQVRVDESLRGNNGPTYTFRQFGLLEPRELPDGTTALSVSPDGWPRFRANEHVLLFLYKPARDSGMQTTVGLLQGKFNIVGDSIENAVGNQNLFHNLDIDRTLLSASQQTALRKPNTIKTDDLVDLVRRAVSERWVENGRMKNVTR